MFDNPKDALQRLQAQLLAEEGQAEPDDTDAIISQVKEILAKDEDFGPEPEPEKPEKTPKKSSPKQKTGKKNEPEKKDKIGGLVLALVLELLALGIVLIWWMKWR